MPNSPIVMCGHRSGTATRYTETLHDRWLDSPPLTLNTQTSLTQSGFPLGRTPSKGWVSSGTRAGRSSRSTVPAIRYVTSTLPFVHQHPLTRAVFPVTGYTLRTVKAVPRPFIIQHTTLQIAIPPRPRKQLPRVRFGRFLPSLHDPRHGTLCGRAWCMEDITRRRERYALERGQPDGSRHSVESGRVGRGWTSTQDSHRHRRRRPGEETLFVAK